MTDIFETCDIVSIITEYTCDTRGVNKLLHKCHKHHLKALKYPRCVYFDHHIQNAISVRCFNCGKYMVESVMTNEEIIKLNKFADVIDIAREINSKLIESGYTILSYAT